MAGLERERNPFLQSNAYSAVYQGAGKTVQTVLSLWLVLYKKLHGVMFLEAQQVERCCSGLQDDQYNYFLFITLHLLQQRTQTPSCKIHSASSGATSQGMLAAVLRGDPNTVCCTAKRYGSCLQLPL